MRDAFGRLINPRLCFGDPPADGSNPGGAGSTPPAPPQLNEHGYPDNTPLAQMTVEHREAYWKHHARKHEANAKPADFDQLAADAAAFRKAQDDAKPADQRAIDEARRQGAAEGRNAFLQDAVAASIRAAVPTLKPEDVSDVLDDLDLSKFVTAEGRLDSERITKLATKLGGTPGTGDGKTGQTPPPGFDPLAMALGHNGAPGSSGSTGGSIQALRQQRRDALSPRKS